MWVRIIGLSSGTKTDIWSMITHVRQQARMNFAMKMWITNYHSVLIAAYKVKNWIAFSICKQKLLRTALTNVGLIWNESTNRFHAIGYIWGNGVIHKFHQITHSIFPPKVKHVSTRPTCTAGATWYLQQRKTGKRNKFVPRGWVKVKKKTIPSPHGEFLLNELLQDTTPYVCYTTRVVLSIHVYVMVYKRNLVGSVKSLGLLHQQNWK